jgi:hypothetical protein
MHKLFASLRTGRIRAYGQNAVHTADAAQDAGCPSCGTYCVPPEPENGGSIAETPLISGIHLLGIMHTV